MSGSFVPPAAAPYGTRGTTSPDRYALTTACVRSLRPAWTGPG
ncbi:hypothetical protein [Streptomyces sp. ALI-76-A]|nr:hypothetical protein [Streptomyces sp. ALI-76-A]MDL5203974.1 hypothetical protein [Streptomyces sp. ALI-76-A]